MSIPKEVLDRCPYMSCYDHDDTDEPFNINHICWFKFTMTGGGDTPRERKEHTQAIQRQMKIGVLQPNGLPTGIAAPPKIPNKLPSATPTIQTHKSNRVPPDPRQVLKSGVAKKIAQQVETSNKSKLPQVNTLAKRIEQLSKQSPPKNPKRVFLKKRK